MTFNIKDGRSHSSHMVITARLAEIIQEAGLVILSTADCLVECPGIHCHTTPNAPTDCRIWPNDDTGIPRISCFHTSCAGACDAANLRMWKAAKNAGLAADNPPMRSTRDQSAQSPGRYDLQVIAELRAEILRFCPEASRDIENDPRGCVDAPPDQQWPHLIALFPDDATIWIGRDIYDSGQPGHVWRFRTAGDWLRHGCKDGMFICPNSFAPGVFSRSNENVVARNFLVVESDTLSRDEVGSIFRWMEALDPSLKLRAVVDTGGKSLHGWFDYPSSELIEGLRPILPMLGCDAAMFKPSQPCRLPGVLRPETGRWQRLIYFRNDDGQ